MATISARSDYRGLRYQRARAMNDVDEEVCIIGGARARGLPSNIRYIDTAAASPAALINRKQSIVIFVGIFTLLRCV